MVIIYSTYQTGWQIGKSGSKQTYQQGDLLEQHTSYPPGWQGVRPDSLQGLPGGAPAPGPHWSGGKGGCEPASGSPPWAAAPSGMLCGDWDSPAGRKQKVIHKWVTQCYHPSHPVLLLVRVSVKPERCCWLIPCFMFMWSLIHYL